MSFFFTGIFFWMGPVALAQGVTEEARAPFDCSQDIHEVISTLEARPQIELYLCVHEREDAGPVLLDRIHGGTPDDGSRNRLSRGMAIWLLGQAERAFTGEEVRALSPSDRNFLKEGIYARRGRESSCTRLNLDPGECSHGEALKHFDWYQPVANYSNRLLQEIDRENLKMVDNPPPAPEPEEEVEVPESERANLDRPGEGACGCSAGSPQGWAWSLWVLPLMMRRRR